MLDTNADLAAMPTELFSATLHEICGSFDVEHDHRNLRGRARCLSKSGLDLAIVDQASTAIRRGRKNIKRDPGNHFFLVVQDQGSARMEQHENCPRLEPGDMFLVDSTESSLFYYGGKRSRQISLHLPREETLNRFGRRISAGMSISRKDPLARAMRNILFELVQNEDPRQGQVAEAFFSVLGAYLFNRSIGERGKLSEDRQIVNRALSVISQHYVDPDFRPLHIANLTGVSLRRLQRAFASIDSSPHRRLQEVRLKAVCDALKLSPELPCQSVTSIAFDCGYRELSTFYRQFKTRYGCSPKDWRAMQ